MPIRFLRPWTIDRDPKKDERDRLLRNVRRLGRELKKASTAIQEKADRVREREQGRQQAAAPDVLDLQTRLFRDPSDRQARTEAVRQKQQGLSEDNLRVLASRFTEKEREQLRRIGYDFRITTRRTDDYNARALFGGEGQRPQTALSPSQINVGRPIGPQSGDVKSMLDLLEHEIRHQLLNQRGVPTEQHHAALERRSRQRGVALGFGREATEGRAGPFREEDVQRIGARGAREFARQARTVRDPAIFGVIRRALDAEGLRPQDFTAMAQAAKAAQEARSQPVPEGEDWRDRPEEIALYQFPREFRQKFNNAIRKIGVGDAPLLPEAALPETEMRRVQQRGEELGIDTPGATGTANILTNPLIPPDVLDTIEANLGPAGTPVRHSLEFLSNPTTAPIGLAFGLPTLAAGEAGAVTLGTIARAAGVPEPVAIGAEIVGGLTPAGLVKAGGENIVQYGQRVSAIRNRAAADGNEALVRQADEVLNRPLREFVAEAERSTGLPQEAAARGIVSRETPPGVSAPETPGAVAPETTPTLAARAAPDVSGADAAAPARAGAEGAARAASGGETVRTRDLFGREVDTFATERELGGIREQQATLFGQRPTESQSTRVMAEIAEERTLAQEALAAPGTRRQAGATADLRTKLETLDIEERILRDWEAKGLTPQQRADDLFEMQMQYADQQLRASVRGTRITTPKFGTPERTEFEIARRGRPRTKPLPERPSEAEGLALDELAARLDLPAPRATEMAGGEALTAARLAERRAARDAQVAIQEAVVQPSREAREAWRLWDGANKEAALNRTIWRDETYRLFDDAGLQVERNADDQSDAIVEVMEGVFGDEAARGKVGAFRPQQRGAVQALYDRLDDATARIIAADPDFELRALPEYFPHQFKVRPEKPRRGIGPRGFQTRPGFLKQRKLSGALGEILESRPDLDLATWDPVAYVDRHIAAADHYINSLETIKGLKAKGLIAPEAAKPPASWRRPDIAPFKIGQSLDGWVAEPKVAQTLEEMFGRSAFDQHGVLKGLKKVRETAFRIKVFGGLFQQVDYTFRGAGLGLSSLARGDAKGAVRAWASPIRAVARSVNPKLDRRLASIAAKDENLRLLYRNGLAAGVDPSIADSAIRAEGTALARLPGGRGLQQAADFLGGEMYERFHREMLEQAGLVNLQKNLRRGLPKAEAARRAVEETNVFFSSIPNWQSAIRSKTGRDLIKFPFFATGELEGWFRLPFQAPAGFAGIVGAVVISAEMLNKAFTGEWLSEDQLKPYQTERPTKLFGKKLPVGFNHHFLRPKLPWKGEDGRDLYLDLLGQADTPFRWAMDPQFALQTRLGQFPRLALDLQAIARGEAPAFGEEIEGPADIGRFAAQTVSPIGVSGLGGSEVERIGVIGGGIQTTGINISAQSRDERFSDLYRDKHGHAPPEGFSPWDLDADLARQAGYTERGETEFARDVSEQLTPKTRQLNRAARNVLQYGPSAFEGFDSILSDWFSERAIRGDVLARDFDFSDEEDELVKRYRALDPYDRLIPETNKADWDYFYSTRSSILRELREQGSEGRAAADALEAGRDWQFDDPNTQRAYEALRTFEQGLDGYWEKEQGKPREAFRRQNPKIDAQLFLLGKVSRVLTPAARDQVRDLSLQHLGTAVQATFGSGSGGLASPAGAPTPTTNGRPGSTGGLGVPPIQIGVR